VSRRWPSSTRAKSLRPVAPASTHSSGSADWAVVAISVRRDLRRPGAQHRHAATPTGSTSRAPRARTCCQTWTAWQRRAPRRCGTRVRPVTVEPADRGTAASPPCSYVEALAASSRSTPSSTTPTSSSPPERRRAKGDEAPSSPEWREKTRKLRTFSEGHCGAAACFPGISQLWRVETARLKIVVSRFECGLSGGLSDAVDLRRALRQPALDIAVRQRRRVGRGES
jgi:hypothetical protein